MDLPVSFKLFSYLLLFSARSACIVLELSPFRLPVSHQEPGVQGEVSCSPCCFCATHTSVGHSVASPDPRRAPYQHVLLPWVLTASPGIPPNWLSSTSCCCDTFVKFPSFHSFVLSIRSGNHSWLGWLLLGALCQPWECGFILELLSLYICVINSCYN